MYNMVVNTIKAAIAKMQGKMRPRIAQKDIPIQIKKKKKKNRKKLTKQIGSNNKRQKKNNKRKTGTKLTENN